MSLVEILMVIGVVGILISGFMVGSWTSGDRQRANFNTVVPEERPIRNKIARWCAGVAAVSFALGAAIYYWF
ncbi:DUF5316 family protein [Paenibacillus daejeonensis]|uniref:DUF5316 family protein n=1 Tax=Paenibacillus daejeonensis TaxID=135193 RepID=UPI00037071D9